MGDKPKEMTRCHYNLENKLTRNPGFHYKKKEKVEFEFQNLNLYKTSRAEAIGDMNQSIYRMTPSIIGDSIIPAYDVGTGYEEVQPKPSFKIHEIITTSGGNIKEMISP